VIPLHETASGITFAVKVQPRARRNAIVGAIGDALKIALTAPAVDGRANDACIEFFAELLNVPRSSITILVGQTGRNKIVRISGATVAQVRNRLQLSQAPHA
jgi:uncharacterized protein